MTLVARHRPVHPKAAGIVEDVLCGRAGCDLLGHAVLLPDRPVVFRPLAGFARHDDSEGVLYEESPSRRGRRLRGEAIARHGTRYGWPADAPYDAWSYLRGLHSLADGEGVLNRIGEVTGDFYLRPEATLPTRVRCRRCGWLSLVDAVSLRAPAANEAHPRGRGRGRAVPPPPNPPARSATIW